MLRARSVLAFVVLAFGLAACGDDQAPTEAAALWTKIQTAKYRTFGRPAGFESRKLSDQPHGKQVDVYYNDVAATAVKSGVKVWPEGALFVKDGYDGADLDVVTAMEKRKDGWFFVEWNASGESLYSGRSTTCTGCHGTSDAATRTVSLPQ
jgi:hypothetical protein